MSKKSKYFVQSMLAGFVALMLIQAIPYGRNHTNPPIVHEPSWDSPATRAIAKRACFNCHSNETIWPWYSWVAPVSWLVRFDVNEGHKKLNFSDWQNGARKAESPDKIRKEITKGEMPPIQYRLAHPEARLSESEKRQLIDGLNATSLRH